MFYEDKTDLWTQDSIIKEVTMQCMIISFLPSVFTGCLSLWGDLKTSKAVPVRKLSR